MFFDSGGMVSGAGKNKQQVAQAVQIRYWQLADGGFLAMQRYGTSFGASADCAGQMQRRTAGRSPRKNEVL